MSIHREGKSCFDPVRVFIFNDPPARDDFEIGSEEDMKLAKAGRCKLKPIETRVESAWLRRLRLKYNKLLSSFASRVYLQHQLFYHKKTLE